MESGNAEPPPLTDRERLAEPPDRPRRRGTSPDLTDTVVRWPATPARVRASAERHACNGIVRALALEHAKGYLLAHEPPHKPVHAPRQHPYRECCREPAC